MHLSAESMSPNTPHPVREENFELHFILQSNGNADEVEMRKTAEHYKERHLRNRALDSHLRGSDGKTKLADGLRA